MDAIQQIQRLGWEFRPDGIAGQGPGVLFTVRMNGQDVRVFVPLQRVWVTFDQELQRVGCPSSASVGAPFSVGGFFSFVKKAVKSIGRKAAALVPKAVKRAAAKVVSVAKSAAKTVLPYVQSVVSFVPGIGTGVSAAIGAARALASGKRIDQIFIEAAKSAIPGGPAAQAAFSVVADVVQGKPLNQVVLNALPLAPAQKAALAQAVAAARDIAAGKRVDKVILERSTKLLPAQYQKALHVGTTIGHAKKLQDMAHAAAHGAMQLAADYSHGVQAAHHYARGVRSPATLAAMRRATASQAALKRIVQHASKGHPQANNIVNALRAMHAPRRPVRPALHVPAALRSFGFA